MSLSPHRRSPLRDGRPPMGPASPTAVSVASSLESYISDFLEVGHSDVDIVHEKERLDDFKEEELYSEEDNDPLERSVEDVERELSSEIRSSTNPYGKQAQRQRRQEARYNL